MLERIVSEVLNLPHDFAVGGSMTDRILQLYTLVKSKLLPTSDATAQQEIVGAQSEDCRMCQHTIPFESLMWARCTTGHQFSRCGLTFSAIQEPGVSKTCTICGTQFLNEWLVPELTQANRDADVEMRDELIQGRPLDIRHNDGHVAVNGETQAELTTISSDWVHIPQPGTVEPACSLARTLFSAFNTCIYCGGKFLGSPLV